MSAMHPLLLLAAGPGMSWVFIELGAAVIGLAVLAVVLGVNAILHAT